VSKAELLERELFESLEPSPPEIPEDPAAMWPRLRRIGARDSLVHYLRDLWRWRNFIITVPLNDLRAQNQDTVLGQLWHLLNPLLLTGIYYMIFGVILGISRGGVDNYVAFLIIGVITFNYARTSMRTGASIIVRNRQLVQNISFPRAALPLSALIEECISHAFALAVMFLVVMTTGVRPSTTWLLVVPIIIVQTLMNLGLAMFVARFTFHFRDTQQFLPYVLRILFYISGVLIPLDGRFEAMPTALIFLRLNPIYIVIDISRDAFMYHTVDPQQWWLAIAWTTALFVGGFLYFRAAESEYGLV
jgi:teichoic acid transport system permease protein